MDEPQLPVNKRRRAGGLLAWLVFISLIVLGGVFIWRPYLLTDWVLSSTYQPSPVVQTLHDRLGLTSSASRVLLASRPEINDAHQFNQNCQQREASVTILGCFTLNQIFVYNVTEPNLNGVMEATMAHELLHAVYQRLPASERAELDQLLEENYRQNRTEELDERLAMYARTEPGERANELHSILGTEFTNLTNELEKHYRQTFDDRQAVVAYHQKYASKFVNLLDQLDQIQSELNQLEQKIIKQRADYEQAVATLNQAINDFNNRADGGYFTSQKQFDTERQSLANRNYQVNHRFTSINSFVDQYNRLVGNYNRIADQLTDLQAGLDSISKVKQPTTEAL